MPGARAKPSVMRLTDRVISLHPAIVTGAFVILFICGDFVTNIYPFGSAAQLFSFSAFMALMLGPLILWHYSLYRASSDRSVPPVGHSGRRAFLFGLFIISMSVCLLLFPLMIFSARSNEAERTLMIATPISMVVAVLSYFASIWASANALTRFDERKKSVELHKTLGTFLLEFYLPVGIWIIHPRIKRLLAAPIPTSPIV